MRRLYSTFAGGWPGVGLLVMRLIVGSVLLVRAGPTPSDLWLHVTLTSASLATLGLLLIAGLWTPVAGTVVAVIEISQIFRLGDHPMVALLGGTIAAGLAMLGPGRWSVDARLFGWRRIEPLPRTKGSNAG